MSGSSYTKSIICLPFLGAKRYASKTPVPFCDFFIKAMENREFFFPDCHCFSGALADPMPDLSKCEKHQKHSFFHCFSMLFTVFTLFFIMCGLHFATAPTVLWTPALSISRFCAFEGAPVFRRSLRRDLTSPWGQPEISTSPFTYTSASFGCFPHPSRSVQKG